MRIRRAALVAIAVASFLSVAAAVRAITPRPEAFGISQKLAHFERHGADYDAIFLGTSLVQRAFDPRVTDAHLARLGVPLRTFNFGEPALTGFSLDHQLREVLAMQGVALDYVFIEPVPWPTRQAVGNNFTVRMVNWHSLRQTLAALRATLSQDEPWAVRWRRVQLHCQAFCWRLCSYGQGERIVRHLIGAPLDLPALQPEDLERRHGYQPLADRLEWDPLVQQRRQAFVSHPEQFAKHIDELGALELDPERLALFWIPGLNDQIALVRTAGAEPIYVVPPGSRDGPVARHLAELGVIPTLLDFSDPDEHPALALAEHYFDLTHLNQDGAREFSTLFAEAVAASIQARERH